MKRVDENRRIILFVHCLARGLDCVNWKIIFATSI